MHLAPLRELHVLGRRGIGDAGGIHADGERAHVLLGALDRTAQIVRAGHVAGLRQRAAAQGADLRDGFFHAGFLLRQVEAGHIRAGLRQADGQPLADAAAGAGHQRDLAAQIEKLHVSDSCCWYLLRRR